jgi:hypothetical protein
MSQTHTNELATNITARINVMEPVPNVDINYGPYENTEIAQQTLYQHGVWDENAIGLTVGVWKDSTHKEVEEYQLIKNDSESLELIVKQAEVTPGATDYGSLTGKPSINNHELSSGNNTLASIGAASASALSTHTGDSKIHVPMTYGGTTTPITGFKIEGEKMTITVGNSEYSFRLSEWVDIADFYVIFSNPVISGGVAYLNVNGTNKPFNTVTGDEFLTFVSGQDADGYQVTNNKQTLSTNNWGDISCDFVKVLSGTSYKGMSILTRKSGTAIPSMKVVVSAESNASALYFNSGDSYGVPQESAINNFNTGMSNFDVTINNVTYNVVTVYESSGFSPAVTFGIKYIK